MYLRYEPDSRNIDTQRDSYQAYGSGSWTDAQIPQAKQLQATSNNGTTPPAAVNTKVAEAASLLPAASLNGSPSTAVEVSKVSQASKRSEESGSSKVVLGSSLLAYRDPDAESSDEDEPVKDNADLSNTGFDVDYDDMDPTSAYVAAKLRYTTLERNLGLSSKSNKKGARSKSKGSKSAMNPAEVREYESLDARLKERTSFDFYVVGITMLSFKTSVLFHFC